MTDQEIYREFLRRTDHIRKVRERLIALAAVDYANAPASSDNVKKAIEYIDETLKKAIEYIDETLKKTLEEMQPFGHHGGIGDE